MLAAESVRCVSKGVRSKLDLNAAAAQGADFMEIVELEASRAWDCGDAHGSAMLFEVGPDTHVWVWTDEWLDHIPLDCPSSEREVHARWRFEVRGDYIWSLIPVPGPSIRLIEATDDLNSSTEVEWSFRVFRRAELPSPLARIVGDAAPTAPRRATGGS